MTVVVTVICDRCYYHIEIIIYFHMQSPPVILLRPDRLNLYHLYHLKTPLTIFFRVFFSLFLIFSYAVTQSLLTFLSGAVGYRKLDFSHSNGFDSRHHTDLLLH